MQKIKIFWYNNLNLKVTHNVPKHFSEHIVTNFEKTFLLDR